MSIYSRAYVEDEEISDDDVDEGETSDEFRTLVHQWVSSSSPPNLWKCFGELRGDGLTKQEFHRIFTIWSSMIERKAGTEKFRMVFGFQRGSGCILYVFIGGVETTQSSVETWAHNWRELGGSVGSLHEFNSFAYGYLDSLPRWSRFDFDVKLPARPRGSWKRKARK